ncbi:MAG TPA: AglZ/HisF2 family acetamidino modification protein [Niabella sp.]
MLRSRVIPCLLVRNKGLVKTVKFKDSKYVGDPLNAVKIFNEKEVDELMILDIDATVEDRSPDFEMIKNVAIESHMPLCYGGGIKTVEQAKKIISLGAEKVAISSAAVMDKHLISRIANAVGIQSVVVVIDVKEVGIFKNYEVVINNAQKKTGLNPVEFAKYCEQEGTGEIVINSVDRDGMMNGYDEKLIDSIRNAITTPLTVLGGAGTLDDMKKMVHKYGTIGVAAGSMFVFKGRYKAVLINYPMNDEKKFILK